MKKLDNLKFTSKLELAIPHSLMLRIALFYSIFLFACLLLIVYIYTADIRNSRNDFWSQNKSILQSSINLLDTDLLFMESFGRQFSQDSYFSRLTRMEDNTRNDFYITAYRVKNNLAAYFSTSSLLPIENYYIYLRNSDYILSINQFESLNLYYYGKRNFSTSTFASWCDLMQGGHISGTMYSMADYHSAMPGYYMYLLDANQITYKNMEATLCFEISSSKLRKVFEEIDLAAGSCLLVADQAGNQMFLLSDDFPAGSPPPYDISTIFSLSYINEYGAFNYEGTPMFVTHLESDANGWHYYLVQPESLAAPAYSEYHFMFIFMLVIGGLAGIVLILFFSRKIVKPVYRLDGQLKEAITDKELLQEEIEQQKPIICGSYVRRLLQGSISSQDEMDYISDYLYLSGRNLHFNVLYTVVYNNETLESEQTADLPQLIQDALTECLSSPQTTVYTYSPEDRVYAILLAFEDDAADGIITIQEKVLKLHDYLLDTYGIWLFAGCGRMCDSLTHIWESYYQASDAANYTAKNYIFLPYEIIKKDSSVFYYPSELSTKLIHFITAGNREQVIELFGLIHQENIEERSLPVNMLKFLLSDIRNTLLKARFSVTAPTANSETLLLNVDRLFHDHLSFKLCEDIALNMCDIFAKDKDSNDLIGNIEKYIQENYRDPSLCLNKISDEFSISESYFSHLFKEKCNVNFSVYLENIRMTEAARIIRETDCNISELYLMVGYNNPTSFRRAFKKKYSVAPSAMR